MVLMLFAFAAAAIHLITTIVVAARIERKVAYAECTDSVTILRPCTSYDPTLHRTLLSTFALKYSHPFEVIFCVADAHDSAIATIQALMSKYPAFPSRLLIGDDKISDNPKLNNLVKGWEAAAHDWIIMCDCNVLMPSNYIQRMFAAWRSDTGMVSSPPIGVDPIGFWGHLECAFLNTHQARWQLFAHQIGLGFAQGKNMLCHRKVIGSLDNFATEAAEDAAASKYLTSRSMHVEVVRVPFAQPIGRRSFKQVWSRQIRWARLRRASFPLYFAPEILCGALFPALIVGAVFNWQWALFFYSQWHIAEGLLPRALNWPGAPFTPMMMLANMFRDLLLPVLWLSAWVGNKISWNGKDVSLEHHK